MDTNVNLKGLWRLRVTIPRQKPFYVIGMAQTGYQFLQRVKLEYDSDGIIFDCLEILQGDVMFVLSQKYSGNFRELIPDDCPF